MKIRVSIPLFLLFAASLAAQTVDPAEFFEKNVRPVLVEKCQMCHNAQLKSSELDLSTAAGFVHGGASGPLVLANDPAKSRLLKVIGYDEQLKMPPTGKLKDEEIANITAWVKMGAPWPGSEGVVAPKKSAGLRAFREDEKTFWAYQPVKNVAPPAVKNEAWVRTPIDRFVLAKLEEKNLTPAAPADRLTLLRRVTYDMTGLPPTVTEIEAFLADNSPNAFEKVVDRLLASPRYGERWGRHWLDVARYADSTGNDEDHRYPYAWRYRDYVIEAFNNDMPYDQFVREQIAGDLLPSQDPNQPINRRGLIATGFLALGPKAVAQQDKKKMLYDIYDEQVDVLSKAFMGLTVACARCHDHKFDAIRTRDYYSLVGMFASTKNFENPDLHVSKLLFTPLVSEKLYEDFKAGRNRIVYKQLDIDDAVAGYFEKYSVDASANLAAYMTAARGVIDNKGNTAAVAKAKNLDAVQLEKWVAYLKASAKEDYLKDWNAAKSDQWAALADGFQKNAQTKLNEWVESQKKFREKIRESAKDRVMPVKPREFSRETDAFVFDVFYAENGPFAVSEKDEQRILPSDALARVQTLRAELKQLEDTAPPEPPMACAVQEGPAVDQKIFIRGDYNSEGDPAPKIFPAIISGDEQNPVEHGSGRLQLANWIARGDNPLTARVMVNRIWQWHFGDGIVRSASNFGKMGDRPTHPELLDYLAQQFVEGGWSVKKMHRMMLLSSAYQTSSQVTDQQAQTDPENLLLSHFSRRRLEVEEIRDGLLLADGSIDFEMGGTMQEGFGTDGENSNDRLSIDPATVKRRMVYLPLRRANLPALLNLFDFGDAATPMAKRPLTNVAPQALFMMNSDFVTERARNLAKEALDSKGSDSDRMAQIYLRTLNRRPDSEEVDTGLTYLSSLKAKFANVNDVQAWESLCRILIGSNEFIYVD